VAVFPRCYLKGWLQWFKDGSIILKTNLLFEIHRTKRQNSKIKSISTSLFLALGGHCCSSCHHWSSCVMTISGWSEAVRACDCLNWLQESKHRKTDRGIFFILKKKESGPYWPRLQKEGKVCTH